MSVPAEALTVTYTLDRFQPQTVAVQPLQRTVVNTNFESGGTTYVMELDPNPVFAQLAPSAPPKRTTRRPQKQAAKRPPADAPPPSSSPFPPPTASSPFPSR